jgi:hypothetical protein
MQVYLPTTIIVELDKSFTNLSSNLIQEALSKEIAELYFSNKKRSGGESVKNVTLDLLNNRFLVTFSDSEGKC